MVDSGMAKVDHRKATAEEHKESHHNHCCAAS